MSSSKIAALLALAVLLAFGAACAKKEPPKPDPFFERWKAMAEQAKGHSVEPTPATVVTTSITSQTEAERAEKVAKTIEPARPLPKTPVTLRLQNVDVSVILRSLARAANMNILLNNSVTGILSLNVDRVPWDQAFKGIMRTRGLTYTWEGDLIRVMSIQDMKTDLEIEKLQRDRLANKDEVKRVEPLVTKVLFLRYIVVDDKTEQSIESMLTTDDQGNPRGNVVQDTLNNALIVSAIGSDLERVESLINATDIPRKQVNLKAHIVETTKDTARDLGIQWGGLYQSGDLGDGNRAFVIPGATNGTQNADGSWNYTSIFGPGFGGQGFGSNFPADLTGGAGGAFGAAIGKLGGSILEFQLSMLEEENVLNVLSSPSITTLDNQMAFTENGEKVPYVATDPEGKLEVKFEEAVLRLEITPHVIEGENLKLRIVVKKDEVDLTRTVQGNPFIIKKQTETTLVVSDSDTIVISGLTRQRNNTLEQGLPWLKDLEGLGRLFRRDAKNRLMEEVLIFITPRILPYKTADATASTPPTMETPAP